MLKLDFDIVHNVKEYKSCWICNSKLLTDRSGPIYKFLECNTCNYTLIFQQIKSNIYLFDGINYNYSIYAGLSGSKIKLDVEFPIDLDKCIDMMKKLQALI
jgi:hypothetical protein